MTITFSEKETIVGYIETDSGGVLMTDLVWAEDIPSVTQERVRLELDLDKCKIPVIAVRKGQKRYLIVSLDDAKDMPSMPEIVTVENIET